MLCVQMPTKWLAIESLKELVFSHKSDVWSLGVTAWEIFTHGDKPYEDIPNAQIKNELLQGVRLSHPVNCSVELYMLLLSCQ